MLMGLEAIHIVIFHASLGRFCRVTSSARPMHPDGTLPMHLVWEPAAPSPGAWAEHIPVVSTSECVWDPPLSECLDSQAVQGWNANADYFSAPDEGIQGPAGRLFPFPAARLPPSPAPSACVWSFDGTKRMLLEKEAAFAAGEAFPPLSPTSSAAAARVFVPGSSPPRRASALWLCAGSGLAPAQLEWPWAEHWRGAEMVREPLRSERDLLFTCVSVDAGELPKARGLSAAGLACSRAIPSPLPVSPFPTAAFLPSPTYTPPVLVSEWDRRGHRSAVWRYQVAQVRSALARELLLPPVRAEAGGGGGGGGLAVVLDHPPRVGRARPLPASSRCPRGPPRLGRTRTRASPGTRAPERSPRRTGRRSTQRRRLSSCSRALERR